MAKVIIPRSELPIPVSDHINKFRYRVVNNNRNIYSDWSVIGHAYQEELDRNSTRGVPSTNPTNPGDILTAITINPVDNWDIGWVPVASWIDDNNVVTVDINHDIPSGGAIGEVLTKASGADYDVFWDVAAGVPAGGTVGQIIVKNSSVDYDASWQSVSISADPQDANLAIGISLFA